MATFLLWVPWTRRGHTHTMLTAPTPVTYLILKHPQSSAGAPLQQPRRDSAQTPAMFKNAIASTMTPALGAALLRQQQGRLSPTRVGSATHNLAPVQCRLVLASLQLRSLSGLDHTGTRTKMPLMRGRPASASLRTKQRDLAILAAAARTAKVPQEGSVRPRQAASQRSSSGMYAGS